MHCLANVYRSAVHSVAREFERQNQNVHDLMETNKQLAEQARQAEEERVFLRQERTRLLEEVAKAQKEDQDREQTRRTLKQLLTICSGYEASTKQLKSENERLRLLNGALIKSTTTLSHTSAAGESTQSADVEMTTIGAFTIPRALVDAISDSIKEPVVQQYEARLAQGMLLVMRRWV
jgi:predicted RNase H-like nuclease (RuvC/YqgF family)